MEKKKIRYEELKLQHFDFVTSELCGSGSGAARTTQGCALGGSYNPALPECPNGNMANTNLAAVGIVCGPGTTAVDTGSGDPGLGACMPGTTASGIADADLDCMGGTTVGHTGCVGGGSAT